MSISCLASNVLTLNSTLFQHLIEHMVPKGLVLPYLTNMGMHVYVWPHSPPKYKKKKSISSFAECIYDALRDFEPFVQFKNAKTRHGGVLLLVKL